MTDEKIYKAPSSELVDKRNDRKLPPATMLVLTPITIFINFLVSLALANRKLKGDIDLIMYLFGAVLLLPVTLVALMQIASRFRNARSRLNALFWTSLALACFQFFLIVR